MSERWSAGMPRACSGDMYPTVPRTTPAPVTSVAVAVASSDPAPSGRPAGSRSFARPKSRILTPTVLRQEQVLGLEVAVDDPLLVGRGQAVGDLGPVLDGLLQREPAGAQPLAQRLALEQLRDHVGDAAFEADVEDREDVRVVEGARRPRLALEALEPVGVDRGRARQHLDRDVAAEAGVAGAIHLTHASCAEQTTDLVGAEPRACVESHG